MEDSKDKSGGNKWVGSIKETIGKVTGNKKLEEEGRIEKSEAGVSEHGGADRHGAQPGAGAMPGGGARHEDNVNQRDDVRREDGSGHGDNAEPKL